MVLSDFVNLTKQLIKRRIDDIKETINTSTPSSHIDYNFKMAKLVAGKEELEAFESQLIRELRTYYENEA